MDLKGAVKLAAVLSLLASAWFVVKMLKPREADLEVINTRDGDFGDMTSAADRRAAGGASDADVSGLDMVPTSSLPLSGPEKPAPAPEPAPRVVTTVTPDPAPAPPRAAPRPVRREKPRLQATESTTGGQSATSSAFMAAPEDEEQTGKRK